MWLPVVPTAVPPSLSLMEPGFSGGPQASFLRREAHEASKPAVSTGFNGMHSLPIQVGDSVSDALRCPQIHAGFLA